MNRFSKFCCGCLLALLPSCAGTTDRQVDPDASDSVTGTGLQSQQIRAIAREMADSLRQSGLLTPTREGERVSFYAYRLRNDSSDPGMDPEIISTKIRTEISRALGRTVRIIDRSAEGNQLVELERMLKDAREVSGNNPQKKAGSDYVLKGTIKSRDRQAGRLKSSYFVITLELVDLVTSELAWTDDFDYKSESERSVINS